MLPLAGEVMARTPVAPSANRAADPDLLPPGAMYRFRSRDGNLTISSVLPQQAIETGYEIIDSRGRVIRTVAAAVPEEERRRMQEQMRIRQQDNQLRRLYPVPEDAERARDRQISSLRLGIDYARGNITQLDGKLSAEVAQAAAAERAGRPVPETVQANIDLYTRQIREQEDKIAQIEQDIVQVGKEFEPIIQRLREISGQR
ncbi:MAG: hypothetical protein ACK4SX_09000 [Alcanivoracaceae bacterium]